MNSNENLNQPSPPMDAPPPPPTYGDPAAPPPPPTYNPSPPQPSFPPPEEPKKARRGNITALIVLVVIAVVIGGFFVLRDRVSNDVTSLAAGECFDEPTVETEIKDVQRQPCNEPHDAEVVAVLTHPAPTAEAYPVVSGFDDYIQENCVPAFEAYLGLEWDTAADYDMGYFRPTLSGWADGDRGFTCYASRSDGQKMTSTVRAAGSTP